MKSLLWNVACWGQMRWASWRIRGGDQFCGVWTCWHLKRMCINMVNITLWINWWSGGRGCQMLLPTVSLLSHLCTLRFCLNFVIFIKTIDHDRWFTLLCIFCLVFHWCLISGSFGERRGTRTQKFTFHYLQFANSYSFLVTFQNCYILNIILR